MISDQPLQLVKYHNQNVWRCTMAQEGKEVVKSENGRPALSLWDVDKWFDDVFRSPFALSRFPRLRAVSDELIPDVDMFESNGDIVLKAELPGMKKEDIEVIFSDGSVTISGEKKQEEEIKRKDYYKWERSYGSFCRSLELPTEVKADKAKSTFKDGILEVRVPKDEVKSKEVKIKIE
jgi:HSP20 family protein